MSERQAQFTQDSHNTAAFKAICRIRVAKPDLLGQVATRLVLKVMYHLATCLV